MCCVTGSARRAGEPGDAVGVVPQVALQEGQGQEPQHRRLRLGVRIYLMLLYSSEKDTNLEVINNYVVPNKQYLSQVGYKLSPITKIIKIVNQFCCTKSLK